MGRIAELQAEHLEWQKYNFPNQTTEQAFLGMIEEMGELAHAQLKFQQGIRGYFTDGEPDMILYRNDLEDGIADLFIFALGWCNGMGIDLESAIEHTWDKVKARDWQANPSGEGFN